jgi:hypothetical protein
MNTRIQELINQCTEKVPSTEWDGKYWNRFNEEKFAQLILNTVIEELNTVKKCDAYTGELIECEKNTILTEQIEWLQEYFGIK